METRHSGVAKKMARTFAAVEAAFQALNEPDPAQVVNPDEYIPATQGRRQFISDLKAKQ